MEVTQPKQDEMWFNIYGKLLRFSIKEFCNVTGLKCVSCADLSKLRQVGYIENSARKVCSTLTGSKIILSSLAAEKIPPIVKGKEVDKDQKMALAELSPKVADQSSNAPTSSDLRQTTLIPSMLA
ncbi:hypothetical protein Fot_03670 [Forsythia ovata]|uniref:DUF1985 domain-containing protein n=1 Tax=Forsythia ovata TaxID=205694 RepID=A0ABD1XAD2_9LAMI